MTGYDHLLQCLFASWFGLAIAYLRGEARPVVHLDSSNGSWKNPGSPGDFTWHRWKFELLETLRGVRDSPGILSKTWIQVLHLYGVESMYILLYVLLILILYYYHCYCQCHYYYRISYRTYCIYLEIV